MTGSRASPDLTMDTYVHAMPQALRDAAKSMDLMPRSS